METLAQDVQQRILQKLRWLSENFDSISPQALSAKLSASRFTRWDIAEISTAKLKDKSIV